jgi:hypothetical protein
MELDSTGLGISVPDTLFGYIEQQIYHHDLHVYYCCTKYDLLLWCLIILILASYLPYNELCYIRSSSSQRMFQVIESHQCHLSFS